MSTLRFYTIFMIAFASLICAPLCAQQVSQFQVVDSILVADQSLPWNWEYRAVECPDESTCIALLYNRGGAERSIIRVSSGEIKDWKTVLTLREPLEPIGDPFPFGVRVKSLQAPSKNHWVIAGDSVFGTYETVNGELKFITSFTPFVSITTDGGKSWSSSDLPSGEYVTAGNIMLDEMFGVLICSDRFLTTSDGGRQWREASYPAPLPGFMNHNRTWIHPDQSIVSIYYDPQVRSIVKATSTNGGTGWDIVLLPAEADANSMYFVSIDEGWATRWVIGTNELEAVESIFHTTDGGLHWETQWQRTSARPSGLTTIRFRDAMVGAAGGLGGQFLYTNDRGENWDVYDSLYYGEVPALGDHPRIESIAFRSDDKLLLGFSSTKAVSFSAEISSVQYLDGSSSNGTTIRSDRSTGVALISSDAPFTRVVVRDILGRAVIMQDLTSPSVDAKIDVSALATGQYFVELQPLHRARPSFTCFTVYSGS